MLVLKDFLLPDTPFRGLILRGPFGFCAYIGVPESHWLADMESLDFKCHWGLTFNGKGGDGYRPEGWHWYGWDYSHAGDRIEVPPELQDLLKESGMQLPLPPGKQWTVEEVEHDIIDVAVSLHAALESSEHHAIKALHGVKKPSL